MAAEDSALGPARASAVDRGSDRGRFAGHGCRDSEEKVMSIAKAAPIQTRLWRRDLFLGALRICRRFAQTRVVNLFEKKLGSTVHGPSRAKGF